MLTLASEDHRDGIIYLWQEAFGDEEGFINDFLDKMSYTENMLVYAENDEVLGMATMLPVFCENAKGRYIYAVATRKDMRGKGICNSVMKAVDDFIIRKNEKFAILVPAGESLFEFYGKMGYSQIVYKPDFPRAVKTAGQCDALEYFKIRKKLFEGHNLIGWSTESLEYILSFGEAEMCDGGAIYREGTEVKEALVPEIFDREWKIPFGEIKYYDENLRFDKPYFGLCIN